MQIAALGADKAALPTGKLLLLGMLAGVYIGFGCLLAMSIGGACPGLAQVPVLLVFTRIEQCHKICCSVQMFYKTANHDSRFYLMLPQQC